MGNVACCKSKTPRSDDLSFRGYRNSNTNRSNSNENHNNQPSPYILQHISEREPDDSETDPSSNPVDRPIFASRSCKLKNEILNSNHNNSSDFSCAPQKNEIDFSNCGQTHGFRSDIPKSTLDCRVKLVDSFKVVNSDNDIFHPTKDSSIISQDQNGFKVIDDNCITQNNYQQSNLKETDEKYDTSSILILNSQLLSTSSSCSTIHCDGSTISQPNLKSTIKGVSLAIYFHIRNRNSDNYVEIFDETIYPLRMPANIEFDEDEKDEKVDQKYVISDSEDENETEKKAILNQDMGNTDHLKEPDRRTIYHFVKTLFKAAQLSSEYAITTLVYLERLMTYAEMDLTPKTWRRMFLGALVLSSKVWEDQAVWNVDYAQILDEISVEDINELERHFLGLIQFNMNVPSSVYAKYYFHLRTLALVNGISKRNSLMTIKEAKILEAFSFSDSNRSLIAEKLAPNIKRHQSLDSVRDDGRSRAVLM